MPEELSRQMESSRDGPRLPILRGVQRSLFSRGPQRKRKVAEHRGLSDVASAAPRSGDESPEALLRAANGGSSVPTPLGSGTRRRK